MKIFNFKKPYLLLAYGLATIVTLISTSCKHKELCRIYDYADVIVKVNFKDVQETEGFAQPKSMRLYVYKQSGEIIANVPLDIYKYEGQKVTLPIGTFHMMLINEESNTLTDVEHPQTRAEQSIYNILSYKLTTPLVPLKAKGMRAPKLKDYEDHVVIEPATPTFVAINKNREVKNPIENGEDQVIEFVPEDPLTRYTIVAKNVKNAEHYLSTKTGMEEAISGALYSISDGFFPYIWESSKDFAIVPHTYKVVETEKPGQYDLITTFRAFGSPAGYPRDNKLQFYVIAGGKKHTMVVDVTQEIRTQNDPRNVYIEIYRLELPKPVGGFSVDVDEWENTENIDIEL